LPRTLFFLFPDSFINRDSNHFLNLYTQYAINYIRGLTVLNTLKQHDADFEYWLHHFEEEEEEEAGAKGGRSKKEKRKNQKKNSRRLPLESLLIAPIQRIPRYRLFLRDLLAHTTAIHVDYVPIKQALEVVTYLCDTINQSLDAPSQDQHGHASEIAIEMDNPLGIVIGALKSKKSSTSGTPPRRRLSTLLSKKRNKQQSKLKRRKSTKMIPSKETATVANDGQKQECTTTSNGDDKIVHVMDGGQLFLHENEVATALLHVCNVADNK
jgi:hypothetical protein